MAVSRRSTSFKESVRDRVRYNLVVLRGPPDRLVATCSASSRRARTSRSSRTSGWRRRPIFGLFIAVFIGIGLVSKEVERRSIYALLSKPVSRPQFIVGKYLGLVLTLAVNVAVMTVALLRCALRT